MGLLLSRSRPAWLAAAGRSQHERIRDDDDTATQRLGELPPTDGLDHAVLNLGAAHARALEDRGHDLAGGGDGELHHDPAAELGLLHQLLLVAVLHLVDVTPDDAADDLLVQRPAHVRRSRNDVLFTGAATTETTG